MTTDETASGDPEDRGGNSPSHTISSMMVSLFREYTGRGPTRARTTIHDDLVVCVLQDTLTKGERSLVDRGENTVVLQTRKLYQDLMREEASKSVAEILDRRVVAFLSDNHIDPDVAVETFLLGPPESNSPLEW